MEITHLGKIGLGGGVSASSSLIISLIANNDNHKFDATSEDETGCLIAATEPASALKDKHNYVFLPVYSPPLAHLAPPPVAILHPGHLFDMHSHSL